MSQQVNVITLGGNLTSDPELRKTSGGTSVTNLRIANNRRRKDASGNWGDRVGYFDVTVWGSQAENCVQYLAKGRGVMVVGELQWREFQDKQGNNRQAIDINAREVQFLSGPEGGGGGGQTRTQPQSDVPVSTGGGYGDFGPAAGAGDDDDIPF